jgi:hypothetical protein
MGNRGPLTCGILAGEQWCLAGVPGDHEQSGTVGTDTACGGSCPVTTQIPRSSSLTSTEESSLTIRGGQGARLPVSRNGRELLCQ